MRQMQKDNEFRFQRLEGGTGGAPAAPASSDHTENTTGPAPDLDLSQGALPGVSPSTTASTSPDGLGAPPHPLGTVNVDENGNPVGGTIAPQANPANRRTETAAIPPSSPDDIYRNAYNAMLQGNYKQAEQGFRDYLDILPDGSLAADASFWLGESEFSQGKFNEAAKTFLDAHQKYPKADKAPETLLKLGMALAALDNRDTACATYGEVLKRYPKASASVRKKVASEQSRAGC
jgi:tol-pal system protein YbgF